MPTGKIEGKKKKKGNGEEKKENCEVRKGRRDFFFLFALHFLKPLKFVWGVPKWKIFYREKAYFPPGKIGKSDFAASEKYSSYASECY